MPWPGPQATDDRNTSGPRGNPGLRLVAQQMWPGPSATLANDAESPESWQKRRDLQAERGINGNGIGLPLGMAAKMWSGPRTARGAFTRDRGRKGQERPTLEGQAITWPGPTSTDGKRVLTSGNNSDLPTTAVHWAGPRTSDWKSGQSDNRLWRKNARPLPEQVCRFAPPTAMTTRPGWSASCDAPSSLRLFHALSAIYRVGLRGVLRLNPGFGEWLMGLPIGWTASGPSATAWTLWRRRALYELWLNSSVIEEDR